MAFPTLVKEHTRRRGSQVITLILNERRKFVWPTLQDIFRDERGVELSQEESGAFSTRRDFEAFLVPNWFAHDRYGGVPQVGVVQILAPQNERLAPPWVVTKPPFPAHIELDDTDIAKIVRDDTSLTSQEETYIVFSKVLEAIERFNRTPVLPKIQRLGCDLEFIGTPVVGSEREMKQEIMNIRKAVYDYRMRFPQS